MPELFFYGFTHSKADELGEKVHNAARALPFYAEIVDVYVHSTVRDCHKLARPFIKILASEKRKVKKLVEILRQHQELKRIDISTSWKFFPGIKD
ncbi:MAG TPA: hypothetical protein VMD74_04810, partial [Candidatus Methylomirabilis sp.]|nr:hypothetical protein [Candidatus Methylomirabilis sp.]